MQGYIQIKTLVTCAGVPASLYNLTKSVPDSFCVNQIINGAATGASVKHKCYTLTIIMYYLNVPMKTKLIQLHGKNAL